MRKEIQAYAALRTGQDKSRPTGNFGKFYRQLAKQTSVKFRTKPITRFAIIRQSQEQARPVGNFGAFYFKRARGY